MREPTAIENDLMRKIIGASIEVHRHLGPGHLESVYDQAMSIEMDVQKIEFVRQRAVSLTYKGHEVGKGRLDFLVHDSVILEIKSVESLLPVHTAQVISYLKLTGYQLGLLINFNVPVLKNNIRRIILSQ